MVFRPAGVARIVEKDTYGLQFGCTLLIIMRLQVGLDVPEASTIVIYNANNFGLAQLHQFRGRVGRGSRPSKCFLLYSEEDSAAQERLALLEREQNGFKIAEADLEHRFSSTAKPASRCARVSGQKG